MKNDFQFVIPLALPRISRVNRSFRCFDFSRLGRIRDEAIVNGSRPGVTGKARSRLHDVESFGNRTGGKNGKCFQNRHAAEERIDQRLTNTNSAVSRNSVRPRLKRVGNVANPFTKLRSFIAIDRNVDRILDRTNRFGSVRKSCRRKRRISTEDHQCLDSAVRRKLLQRLKTPVAIGINYIRVNNCLASVAEFVVQVVSSSVNFSRLVFANHNQASTWMRHEVMSHRRQNAITILKRLVNGSTRIHSFDRSSERSKEASDVARSN